LSAKAGNSAVWRRFPNLADSRPGQVQSSPALCRSKPSLTRLSAPSAGLFGPWPGFRPGRDFDAQCSRFPRGRFPRSVRDFASGLPLGVSSSLGQGKLARDDAPRGLPRLNPFVPASGSSASFDDPLAQQRAYARRLARAGVRVPGVSHKASSPVRATAIPPAPARRRLSEARPANSA
jgi:hypothetical protein